MKNLSLTTVDLKFTKTTVIQKLISFQEHEKEIKIRFIAAGHKVIGEKFEVDKQNAALITNLLKYFTGNDGKFDISKGIYIHGPYGVGKTVLFETLKRFLADNFWMSPNGFHTTSIERIIERYKNDNSLDYYGYNKDSKSFNLCINEFGKKIDEKIYGTDVEYLINSLFMIRYELFQNRKAITHITSNFNPSALKLPALIKDRLNEMFNFIEINGESLRK